MDTTGSKAIQAAYNKDHKPLKSDEILAQRSAVPSVDTHKRPIGVTDGVIEVSGKRRKGNGLSHSEYERLRKVAYGKQGLNDVVENVSDAPAHDPWAAAITSEKPDSRFDYLEKKKPIKAPPTLKEPPVSSAAGAKDVPAVAKPRAGTSYNPLFQEWNALLTTEGAKEVEAEKKRLRQAQAERELAERIAAVEEEVEREAALMTEDESAWEGFESDYEKAEWLGKKRPQRKTPQERKKSERKKERAREEKHKRRQKEKERREKQIIELKAELDREIKKREEGRMQKVTVDEDDQSDVDAVTLRRRKFGKEAIPEPPLELVLPDELQESLRLLKPEGNLLKDRYRNLLVRGKVESRKPIQQPKKKRMKATEKWTYKDFEVPV